MQIIDNLIIVALHILCFIAGMKVSDNYHRQAALDKKDALERQFMRLRVKADADDPVRPYIAPRATTPVATGDFDEDGPLGDGFMRRLKETGRAKTSFRKSDLK